MLGGFGRIDRTREEVAAIIEAFLNGTDQPTDWDDFTSIPIKDEDLDAVRQRCSSIYDDFPNEVKDSDVWRYPNPNTARINPDGIAVLKNLVKDLRSASN